MGQVAAYRGYDITVSDEIEGGRRWSVSRSSQPAPAGWAVRTGDIGSFRQAMVAAQATIDAAEPW